MNREAWGADTYELDRALSLARYQEDKDEVARLEGLLQTARSLCPHSLCPPESRHCWRCGQRLGPELHKVEAYPLAVARVMKGGQS